MEMYHFVTHWFLDAPVERVWAELTDVASWPAWWSSWKKATPINPGAEAGVGSVVDNAVKGTLPYSLRFRTETTRVERLRLIEIASTGQLVGTGKWVLEPRDGGTAVTYFWDVGTSNPLLNYFARLPLARRMMEQNHDHVMNEGLRGLKARLQGQ